MTIRWFGLPAQQCCAGVFDDVETFFEEDFQKLGIMPRRVVAGRRFDHLGTAGITQTKLTNGLDQFARIAQRTVVLQLFEEHGQSVMALLQQLRQRFAVAVTAVHQAFIKAFQLMGQIADRLDLGHPRTALEGVQIAL